MTSQPIDASTPTTSFNRVKGEPSILTGRFWLITRTRCVAVPVEHGASGVAHAVSLAGPAFRLTRARAEGFVDAIRAAAARIHPLLEVEQLRPSGS